jgi:hypothetical protein
LRDDAIGVSGLVDSAAFLGQVVLPVGVEVFGVRLFWRGLTPRAE